MKRYKFLEQEQVFMALNRVRDAFLAADDGEEVEEVMSALLTFDERMKVGRRVQIAEMIEAGYTHEEIVRDLKVGRTTVALVVKLLDSHPKGYAFVMRRQKKVEREYKSKKERSVGGSKLIFKKKEYTGFTRKDVRR